MALLFRNVLLLDGSMEKALRADLLVQGETISRIAPPGALSGQDCEVMDGRGETLLIPGFFNAHCHAAMTLLRGLGEEAPLMEWLEQRIWPLEARLTPSHVWAGTLQAICEMALCGASGSSDMYMFMEQAAEAFRQTGMRGAVSVGLATRDPEKFQKSLYRSFEAFQGERIRCNLDPHAPYTSPYGALCEISQFAVEHDMPVQFHFLEAPWERDYFRDTLKMTPVEYLEKTGLARAPRLVLAHGVQFTDEELDFVAEHPNITVVHCPSSNLKLGSGVAPVPQMLRRGIHVALGTDGASSNNRLDLWGEMRLTALMHKGFSHDAMAVSSRQALRCATFEGAQAFGFEKTGMIREGWNADLTVLSLDSPRYLGADEENLSACLVFSGGCEDVRHVLCGGTWLLKDRELCFMPQSRILQENRRVRAQLTAGQ